MKKIVSLFLLCSLSASNAIDKIILTHPVIEFIDGKTFGINGDVIGFMLKVRHKVLALLHSSETTPVLPKNPTASALLDLITEMEIITTKLTDYTHRANKAILNYQPISTALSAEEITDHKHLQEKFSLGLCTTIEMIIVDTKRWTPGEYQALMAACKSCLKQAKLYFHEIVEPFIVHAQGAKSQMIELIDESCAKRHRTKSLLRGWGGAEEGTEVAHFDRDMQSFAIYKEFCTDLANFLEDIMRSCPKGLEQFKKIVQEEKKKHPNG